MVENYPTASGKGTDGVDAAGAESQSPPAPEQTAEERVPATEAGFGRPPAPAAARQPAPTPPAAPEQSRKRTKIAAAVVAAATVLALSGAAAAHFAGLITIPFLPRHYEPEEVMERMYAAWPEIKAATYTAGLKAYTEPRWAGVKPLVAQAGGDELSAADRARLEKVNLLISRIRAYKPAGGEGIYYPRTLLEVTPENIKDNVREDLKTGLLGYRQDKGGRDFLLVVRLSSPEAARRQGLDSFSFPATDDNGGDTGGTSRLYINEGNMIAAQSALAWVTSRKPQTSGFQYLPVDFELDANLTGQARGGGEAAGADSYRLDGSLKLGGTTFEGDVEAVMDTNKNDIYLKLNRLPSLGFFDPSAVKGKWIKVDPQQAADIAGAGAAAGAGAEEMNERIRRQYKMVLEVMRDTGILTVVKELPMSEEEGRKLYHYEIDVPAEKIPVFYEKLAGRLEAKFGEEAVIRLDKKYLETLRGQQFKQDYQAARDNTTMELWIEDKTFYPVRYKAVMYVAPPDSAEKFKDKQLTVELSVDLQDVNQPADIKVPSEAITGQEAMRLITGRTPSAETEEEARPTSPARAPAVRP